MAVYSKKYKSLKELPKGATIYVSNNPAEQGRFLKFFVDEGLIKLKDGVKIQDATFKDITENKKDNPYANLIAVQKGHKDDKKVQELVKALQSKEVKDYINKKYDGAVVPAE